MPLAVLQFRMRTMYADIYVWAFPLVVLTAITTLLSDFLLDMLPAIQNLVFSGVRGD